MGHERRVAAVRFELRRDTAILLGLGRGAVPEPSGFLREREACGFSARQQVEARLVLLGNFATDDPEGSEIFESLCACQGEDIRILTSGDDTALVNALQSRAAVVLQKSLREGFGLTVAEAMWKRRPVIGGNVGGIRYQIENGVNGFLVESVEEAAACIVRLFKDNRLRDEVGARARERVRDKFLLSRYVEQYLDLFSAF